MKKAIPNKRSLKSALNYLKSTVVNRLIFFQYCISLKTVLLIFTTPVTIGIHIEFYVFLLLCAM
jgi:hypothetical protein